MGTCVVMAEQQAAGASVWTSCAPSLEDLEQANVDVPLGVDCLPLLKRNRGHVTGFGEEDAIICLEVLLDLLNFTSGLSPERSQTEDCCLVSGSYCYTEVSLPIALSQTRSYLPPSNFRSM